MILRSVPFIFIASMLLSGCSSHFLVNKSSVFSEKSSHPLKTKQDLLIEKALSYGVWAYQPQTEDCKDTQWEQKFDENRYYQSVGSACEIKDAFSVDAESWHVKNNMLYIVNLAPDDSDDIIIKYGIKALDRKKLILLSNGYEYTFLRQ